MKILYIGHLEPGGTCRMRMHVLQELGHVLSSVDIAPRCVAEQARRLWPRIRNKLGMPSDLAAVNSAILSACGRELFDVIWLDRAITVWPQTLATVRRLQPKTPLVGYSLDDMAARHNHSRYFLRGLPLYHVFFTNKSYNVAELSALGAPQVRFMGNAYDREIHRPIELTSENLKQYGADVGFIGTFEKERAKDLLWLAHQGICVRVFGNGWRRFGTRHANLRIEEKAVMGHEYSKAICAAKISLCFLRKLNRDRQTTRSVEIPACGGFMLAERTDEHTGLFVEGVEAEFFDSREELTHKCRYYLANAQARQRIAEKGRERCVYSGYSYHEQLRAILHEVERIRVRV